MAGTKRTRAQLAELAGNAFRTGNTPSNADFQNLVASCLSLLDDDATKLAVDSVTEALWSGEYADFAKLAEDEQGRKLLQGMVNALLVEHNNYVSDLADPDTIGKGDALIAGKRTLASAIAFSQHKYHENRPINVVTDFDAPTDGVSYSSTALQAAFNAVPDTGGVVYLPPLNFRIGSTTHIAIKPKTTLFAYGATISQDAAGVLSPVNGALEIVGTSGVHKPDVSIIGLTLEGNQTAQVLHTVGILGQYVDNLRLKDVKVRNFGTWGIFIADAGNGVWIIDPIVNGIWGDGIHLDGLVNNAWIVRPKVNNSYDGGIGITKGPTNVFIVKPIIDGTTVGAGIDLAGCSDIFVSNPVIKNYGQHGIRIITNTGTDTYRVTINDPNISNPTGLNQCINVVSPNLSFPGEHITINRPVLRAGAGQCMYVGNAANVHVNDPYYETSGTGLQFDSASTNNVFINRPVFKRCAIAVKESFAASPGRIEIIDPKFIGVTTHVDNPTYPTRIGPTQRQELVFFKNGVYTTTSATPSEIDIKTRIKKISAGTRVELMDYASDAGGGGDAVIELYNYTNNAVLLTQYVTGGGAAAWRSGGTVIIPQDIEVGLRFYRTVATPVFTVNSAVLLVY